MPVSLQCSKQDNEQSNRNDNSINANECCIKDNVFDNNIMMDYIQTICAVLRISTFQKIACECVFFKY